MPQGNLLSSCFGATWILKQENWNNFLITGLGNASQLLWWMHAPVTFSCSLGTRCKHKLSPAPEVLIFLGGARAVSAEILHFILPCRRQWCLRLQLQPAHDRTLLTTNVKPLQLQCWVPPQLFSLVYSWIWRDSPFCWAFWASLSKELPRFYSPDFLIL